MVPPSSHRVSRVRRYSGFSWRIFSFAYGTLTLSRWPSHAITSERPRDGSFGKQSEMVTAYFIYVKKSDFTAAVKALGAKTAEK